MPISIRTRLTVTFTIVLVIILVIANLALSGFSRRLAVHRADHALREGSKTITQTISEDLDEAAEEDAKVANAPKTQIQIQTFDATPLIVRAIQHTQLEMSEDHVDFVVIEDRTGRVIKPATRGSGLTWPLDQSQSWRVRIVPVQSTSSSSQHEAYTVVTGIPWYRIAADLKTQDTQVAELCAFFVLISAIATWRLVGYTLRPIALLAEQARALRGAEPSSIGLRLSASSPDSEVVRLVGTLNLLLENIAESAEAKARFYTAASHELRTPLHVLCGQVELTLSRPRTADAYKSAMQEVQNQTERLSAIIESLLLLNRLDRGTPEARSVEVSIDSICQKQLNTFALLIESQRLSIAATFQGELTPESSANVHAPEMHVEILMRNLIENAVKYGVPGGQIRLHVWRPLPQGPPAFSIHNEAAGIDPGEFERVCEPFYRPDISRSAQTGGNGLGLSICRALAEANGWKLTLRQDAGGVTAMVVFTEKPL